MPLSRGHPDDLGDIAKSLGIAVRPPDRRPRRAREKNGTITGLRTAPMLSSARLTARLNSFRRRSPQIQASQLSSILVATGLSFFVLLDPASACLPEFTALDVFESYDGGQPRTFSHYLKSQNVGGIFTTRAALVGSFSGEILELKVRYDIEGLALPYNVYVVLVATPHDVLSWQDLTAGCIGPGKSVFPGGQLSLQSVKGLTKSQYRLHLIVWGR
jgi:hypothetical protein